MSRVAHRRKPSPMFSFAPFVAVVSGLSLGPSSPTAKDHASFAPGADRTAAPGAFSCVLFSCVSAIEYRHTGTVPKRKRPLEAA